MNKVKKCICSLLAVMLLCPAVTASAGDGHREVILGGMPFGLTMYTGGVIVVNVDDSYNSPASEAGIRENDIITRADGAQITSNEQLQRLIETSEGEDIELSVMRGKSPISLSLTPERNDDGEYTAGMWIRDSTAGLGTVTYFDESTMSFGALGHGICDRDTGMLLPLGSGKIVKADITSVNKGQRGVAGGLNGYMTDEVIGDMSVNNAYGVYGRYTRAPEGERAYCAHDSEITTGKAYIMTTLDDGETKRYEARIESLNLNNNTGQNMVIRVTNEELLDKTGGIVQGMSGSPIIQDGMLVGAVTHVFVNSPEKGYGISVNNMLRCYEENAVIK